MVPIVYGLATPDTMDLEVARTAVLGGCVIGPQEWACLACEYTWPLPPEILCQEPVDAALSLTYEAHGDQVRKGDGSPYVGHAIEVAHMLFEAGYDSRLVAAGLLHDVIEDAGVTAGEIADVAGAPVAAMVETLTERKEIGDYDRRKLEHRARVARSGARAVAVYAADKLSNMRALREAYAVQGESLSRCFNASLDEKLVQVRRDVGMIRRMDSGNPFVGELELQDAVLRSERVNARSRWMLPHDDDQVR